MVFCAKAFKIPKVQLDLGSGIGLSQHSLFAKQEIAGDQNAMTYIQTVLISSGMYCTHLLNAAPVSPTSAQVQRIWFCLSKLATMGAIGLKTLS